MTSSYFILFRPHPGHMEISGPGVKFEPQLQLGQLWILNPLPPARDLNPCCHRGSAGSFICYAAAGTPRVHILDYKCEGSLEKPHCYGSTGGPRLCCRCFKGLTLRCSFLLGDSTPGSWRDPGAGSIFRQLTPISLSFVLLKDWNTFLLRFNDLDLCVSENETLKHLTNDTTTPESTMTSGQARTSTQSPQSLEDSGPVNISVAITLTLDPLKPFGGYSRNVTHLYSTILGHQIGLSGMWVLAGSLAGFLGPHLGKTESIHHVWFYALDCFLSGFLGPHLQHMEVPQPTEWGQGSKPHPHGY